MKYLDDEQYTKFITQCKLYFSSLSARGTPFAYFNIPIPCDLVLTNSTSARTKTKKGGAEVTPGEILSDRIHHHGDRLTSYSVADLSMHLITWKDKSFFKMLRRILRIPKNVYYVVNVVKMISLFNKFDRDDLYIEYDSDMNLIITSKEHPVTDINKNYVGHPIVDYHVVSKLRYYTDIAYDTLTEEHKVDYPRVVKNIDPKHTLVTGRLFFLDIHTWEYATDDGRVSFPDKRDKIHLLCVDGMNCVSLKEFLPKFKKNNPYTLDFITWAIESSYVVSLSMFTNADVQILSFRPNIVTFPCPNLPRADVDLGSIDIVKDDL